MEPIKPSKVALGKSACVTPGSEILKNRPGSQLPFLKDFGRLDNFPSWMNLSLPRVSPSQGVATWSHHSLLEGKKLEPGGLRDFAQSLFTSSIFSMDIELT